MSKNSSGSQQKRPKAQVSTENKQVSIPSSDYCKKKNSGMEWEWGLGLEVCKKRPVGLKCVFHHQKTLAMAHLLSACIKISETNKDSQIKTTS